MIWARMLAYSTGTVDQELLLRNEYLAAENLVNRLFPSVPWASTKYATAGLMPSSQTAAQLLRSTRKKLPVLIALPSYCVAPAYACACSVVEVPASRQRWAGQHRVPLPECRRSRNRVQCNVAFLYSRQAF